MELKRITPYIFALLMAACSGGEEISGPSDGEDNVTVIEYRPAPGQFINERMSVTTQPQADRWAQERLAAGSYVSLGAFGGYIVVRMPAPVANKTGYDFSISGNALPTNSEPGIVWVAADANGVPGTWYELKGSDSDATSRSYKVTYYRPAGAGDDVRWESEDSDGNFDAGYIKHLPEYHSQAYYPAWITGDSYTLTGSFLAARTELAGNEWVNRPFDRGYADNFGTGADTDAVSSNGYYRYNRFDITDAIDADGNPVTLGSIEYIKVQTAVLADAGPTGEVSTEVVGFKAL